MAHEEEALWAYASGDLPKDQGERVRAHLALCVDCALTLEQVRQARSVLAGTGPHPRVPELPAERWRAIDQAVIAAAREELSRPRWRSFLSSLQLGIPAPAWAGAALACGLAAAVLFWPRAPRPQNATAPASVANANLPPLAPPVLEVREPPPPEAGKVRVASAKRAHAGATVLSAHAVVAQGSSLSTERQGELRLSLPDGSRAALLGSSDLKLERVSAEDVELRVAQGTLLVAASHRRERPFEIRAGQVEVHVVGTRFLVARDEAGVDVAVEEGAVEAGFKGRTQRVPAGKSVRFSNDGRAHRRALDAAQRLAFARLEPVSRSSEGAVTPMPGSEPGAETPAIPQPAEAGPVIQGPAPGSSTAPPVEEPVDTDWNAPPASIHKTDSGAPAPHKSQQAPWPPIKLPLHMDTTTPLNQTPDEHRVRQIQDLADGNECDLALERADRWLQAAGDNANAELKRRVVLTKARCLRKLGRDDDAARLDAR